VQSTFATNGDGVRCERFLEQTISYIPVRDLELDECWSYVQKKEGHKHPHEMSDDSIGDQYIYIGLERTSKLVVAWHLGKRNRANTEQFIAKVDRATASEDRFDVSTDSWLICPSVGTHDGISAQVRAQHGA
jgi:IS1 family transposase